MNLKLNNKRERCVPDEIIFLLFGLLLLIQCTFKWFYCSEMCLKSNNL